jgi:hypothetical protein
MDMEAIGGRLAERKKELEGEMARAANSMSADSTTRNRIPGLR